jgi:hypothetical protein
MGTGAIVTVKRPVLGADDGVTKALELEIAAGDPEEDGAATAACPFRGLQVPLSTHHEPPLRRTAIPRVERTRDIDIIQEKGKKENRSCVASGAVIM